jgi:hypothetical protein
VRSRLPHWPCLVLYRFQELVLKYLPGTTFEVEKVGGRLRPERLSASASQEFTQYARAFGVCHF